MNYRLEFNAEAENEFRDAYLWYENRQKGLGEKFISCVEACLQTISIHPEFFAIRKRDYREAPVKIFPYLIVYQVLKEEKLIHISAVYHGKRHPAKKFRKRK
jgi:plasmid stabilization system protein ParE